MQDRFTVRSIAAFLGTITLVVVIGCIWLTADGKALPDALISIGSTSLGGLVAFLVSTKGAAEDAKAVGETAGYAAAVADVNALAQPEAPSA